MDFIYFNDNYETIFQNINFLTTKRKGTSVMKTFHTIKNYFEACLPYCEKGLVIQCFEATIFGNNFFFMRVM